METDIPKRRKVTLLTPTLMGAMHETTITLSSHQLLSPENTEQERE